MTDVASWGDHPDLATSLARPVLRVAQSMIDRDVRPAQQQLARTFAAGPPEEEGRITRLDLPDTVLAIQSVAISSNTGAVSFVQPTSVVSVKFVAPGTFEELVFGAGYLQDHVYTFTGSRLRFFPALAPGEPISVVYHASLPRLEADSDTNWLLENAYDIYLFGCLSAAGGYLMDQDFGTFEVRYQRAIQAFNAAENRKYFPVFVEDTPHHEVWSKPLMLPPQPVRAARWLPDLYDPDNPGYTVVQNAMPHEQGFSSVRGVVPDPTTAVGGIPVGSIWGRDSDNNPYDIVGCDNGVYFLGANNTWTQRHPGTLANAENWSFTQFRTRIIGVTPGMDVHYADLDELSFDNTENYFRPLPGTPPRANRVAGFRDFVVLGNLDGYPHRVQWSGFNNSELWTPSGITQSGLQDLPGRAGAVQQIVPGERALIFQENSIHRMTHTGGSQIMQFDEVERNRGTQAPNSVCWTGDKVFYYSPIGFFEYSAEASIPIGHNKVDEWVRTNVPDTRTMRGVVDPRSKIAAWSISRGGATHFTHVILYRWDIEAWSLLALDHTLLSVYVTSGIRLDDMALNDFYADNIDNPEKQISFDSPIWTPGALTLNAWGTDNSRGGFEGAPLPATFETGFRPIMPGAQRFFLNYVRPLLDRKGQVPANPDRPDPSSVTVQAKNDISDVGNERESTAPVRPNGRADVRLSGRYASFRLDTTGHFSGVSGFIVHAKPKGGRSDS